MKITRKDNKFLLTWEYNIKNNKTIKNGVEYYFYSSIFPAELVEYYGYPDEIWMYNHKGHNYITNDEPPYSNSRRFKLFQKGKPQKAKNFTLSKKFFDFSGYVEGKIRYTLYLDETDTLIGERGILEISIIRK